MSATRETSDKGDPLLLTAQNLEDLKKLYPRTVPEKARKLLDALARRTTFYGETVRVVQPNDYPIASASRWEELDFLISYLKERGWVNVRRDTAGCDCVVTPDGWERLDADRKVSSPSSKVFVAMWFAPDMTDAYESGIAPAVEADCGYTAVRIDRKEHNNRIDEEIIAEIKESRFVVADFTGNRGGVYFEAGFASGLGLPVIWLCRHEFISQVHFDTRQFNHILWSNADDLRHKLTTRIRATVGLAPNQRASKA